MIKNIVTRHVALSVVFCAVGLILFTENVRPVQIIGLFACGMIVGVALTNIIIASRTKQKEK